MKILIYVPLAPMTPKVYARTVSSVFAMQWAQSCEIVFGREDMATYPTHDVGYLNLMEKHNRARAMALDGGYDALFLVESDMVVPPLALERLSRIDADVAYGLYVSRHGRHQWLAYSHLIGDPYMGTSLGADEINAREAWGQVVDTVGVGMGCTLIHRNVLERLEFRCPDTKVADDWFFALDCQEKRFRQAHDCGVVCGHIQGAPDPKIYWPEPDGKYSVQFFDNGLPEAVQLTNGYQVHIGSLDKSIEVFQAPVEA